MGRRLLPVTLLTLGMPFSIYTADAHDHTQMMQMESTAPIPGDSLHRMSTPLLDQHGKKFRLGDEHRNATLLSMFYGDCQIACPIILENAKRTVEALPAAQRTQVRVVLISLNPGVDTPTALNKLASTHSLPEQSFRLAVSDNDAHTRELAAALGIKYRKAANGEINHSTRLVLTDQTGRIVASSDKLGVEPDEALLTEIRKQLK